jgi:dolichol kinase
MNKIDNGTINYKDEVLRKLIHLCSLSIPIVYYYITRESAIIILSFMTLFFIVVDVARYFVNDIGKLFYNIFGFMLRKHEMDNKKRNLNGATWVLISALACVIIFPKVLFITAFAVLIISDSTAALIGRRFGRHKFLSKSLEGTVAFFISAVIVVFFSPKIAYLPIEFFIGIVAVAIGAIAENISYGWADDNLTIPISIGFSMWGLYLLLLPNTELILLNSPQ